MAIEDRLRGAFQARPKLRLMPLRTKLVASVLVLVFAALALISTASTYALHRYLVNRMDAQLSLVATVVGELMDQNKLDELVAPDYFIAVTTIAGDGASFFDSRLTISDVPSVIQGTRDVAKHRARPFTTRSRNGQAWRMLVVVRADQRVIQVAQQVIGIDAAIGRLVKSDLLVGIGVLIALAAVGAALVRQTLVPLVQIERTAGAIAAGDLSRRVPDPEPDVEPAKTELGRLSRALNSMLAQIEAAFTARAHSETAARAAESAARDAAVAAKASEARAVRSEAKMRQFVADASHELRTPLTTIRGFAELYRQGAVQDPAEVARLVRRIEDESARMGLLVEDLLLLARLDRERPLDLAPVELPVLAMDAVQAAHATDPERTIELDIRDKSEELVAYGDDARLRQVIGNLMTNALTHTPPEASVTLRLSREPGNQAVIDVIDTGPGVAPAQRDRIFERFYRVDEARTRHTDGAATGTGLGLAIVAAIVRAHHGSVHLVSEPGEGSTFRVILPLLDAEMPESV